MQHVRCHEVGFCQAGIVKACVAVTPGSSHLHDVMLLTHYFMERTLYFSVKHRHCAKHWSGKARRAFVSTNFTKKKSRSNRHVINMGAFSVDI